MRTQSLLRLRILTPEIIVLDTSDVLAINIPTGDAGTIGIRPGHAPLIAETNRGIIKFRKEDGEEQIALYAGILSIQDNVVTIMTAGEIDMNRQDAFFTFENKYERLLQTLVNQIVQEDTGSQE